jgi:hypothetical protein
MPVTDTERLRRELARSRACVSSVRRLADRLDRAASTGVPPEGWLHHVDCAEAARAIRTAIATEAGPTA